MRGGISGIKEILKNIFPITFSRWWFASTYFVFFLISPYIGKLLRSLSKKEYQCMLALITVCWCIIPTFTTSSYQSNSLWWFIYLYAISGYIRIYAKEKLSKGKVYLFCSLVFVGITFLSTVVFDVLGTRISFLGKHATYFYGMQKLPVLLISLFIFLGFLQIDIGYRKFVNTVASATFGVYLIHDNGYVRSFLWNLIFKNSEFSNNSILPAYSIVVIISVFIICTLIELLRIYFIEKHYIQLIKRISSFCNTKKEQILSMSLLEKF